MTEIEKAYTEREDLLGIQRRLERELAESLATSERLRRENRSLHETISRAAQDERRRVIAALRREAECWPLGGDARDALLAMVDELEEWT